MLDDLKLIHERDAQDALGIAEKQWQQIDYDMELINELDVSNVKNIVVCGMGGSALAALIFKTWPGINLPFEIWRDYSTPSYVNEETLVILSSYSGNTEETISAYEEAKKRKSKIAIICAGGILKEIAESEVYSHIVLPQVGQPRFAALYGLNALVTLLSKVNLLSSGKLSELKNATAFLKEKAAKWRADIPTSNNFAKQLAYEAIGKSPVIYAGNILAPIAYKWKISFNENAKNVAWSNKYPEFNHNEFLGWTSHPIDKPYEVFDLRSSFDNPRIKKRFELSEKLLSGKRPAPNVIEAEGDSAIEQILYTAALGDFVSIYTAILNGLNPTPVDIIEKLKKELA